MCTTKDLIEFLKQFPEDTEVEVLRAYMPSYDTFVRWEPLSLKEYSNTWVYIKDHNTLYLGDY